MTDEQLAEWMHSRFCTLNHMDQCDWDWGGHYSRGRWLKIAETFRRRFGEDRAAWLTEGGYETWKKSPEFTSHSFLLGCAT